MPTGIASVKLTGGAKQKPPKTGRSPQKKILSETPDITSNSIPHGPVDAYGLWLGDPNYRYGRLSGSTSIPIWVKLEMLRDPVIAWCQAFVAATLVKATRVIECTDKDKQRFFDAMVRAWEREFILQASMGVPFGAVGLIKQYKFAIPQPVQIGDPPVWTSDAIPYICTEFDQIHPLGASPRFDDQGHFDGIDASQGHIDKFYSLWIPFARYMAFGAYTGYGRLENAYRPFWLGNFSADNFAVYIQKNLDPTTEVGYPPGTDKNGKSNQTTALEIGDSARGGATVAMPTSVYTVSDSVSGEEKPTGVRKWSLEFKKGAQVTSEFLEIFRFTNEQKSLGYLLPPQAFLEVGGGDLGGPTTADVLTNVASEMMLSDAAAIDLALNKWLFPVIDHANFPPGSPPVRIRTTELGRDDRDLLKQILMILLGRPDVSANLVNLAETMKRLHVPTNKGEPQAVTPPEPGDGKLVKPAGGGEPVTPPEGNPGTVASDEVSAESGDTPAAPSVVARLASEFRSGKLPKGKDGDDEEAVKPEDIVAAARQLQEAFPEAFE